MTYYLQSLEKRFPPILQPCVCNALLRRAHASIEIHEIDHNKIDRETSQASAMPCNHGNYARQLRRDEIFPDSLSTTQKNKPMPCPPLIVQLRRRRITTSRVKIIVRLHRASLDSLFGTERVLAALHKDTTATRGR